MATKKKMLMSAAGSAGGGASLDITDVFSTYLYTGNGGSQAITNGINLGDNLIGGYSEFTGASENLTRSADLTNNADSKEFTLSVWIKVDSWTTASIIKLANGYFTLKPNVNGTAQLLGANASGTYVLKIDFADGVLPEGLWFHLLVSVDLASNSNRYVYVNNAAVSPTYTTYTNTEIDFTRTPHKIAGDTLTDVQLAHLYLDYTYRNLSTESNRLLFYNTDGAPTAGQADLNPILYLPMDGSSALGVNAGTGGDFTVTGSPSEYTIGGPGYESGSGEGGMVWVKSRTTAFDHMLADTETGAGKYLSSNTTQRALGPNSTALTSFNSNGFSIGSLNDYNYSGDDMASWTFRKSPKFFTCLTYTGNGVAGRTISHDLGTTVGMLVVKRTDSSASWVVYHKGLNGGTNPEQYYTLLDSTAAEDQATTIWNDTAPTSSEFTVGTSAAVNNHNNATYVAYLFAHNDGDGEFGPDGDQDIIKCGNFVNNNTTEVDLGFEPQFVMIKSYDTASNWEFIDNMRGMPNGSNDHSLRPNSAAAEISSWNLIEPTATGFKLNSGIVTGNGGGIFYMAIRRGPLAVPEDATEVFDPIIQSGTGSQTITTGNTVDLAILRSGGTSANQIYVLDRMRGGNYLTTTQTNAENSGLSSYYDWDSNTGVPIVSGLSSDQTIWWMWKRAPGFFDVVAYTGTGSGHTSPKHNLLVAPEMIWVKRRNNTDNWRVLNPNNRMDVLNQGGTEAAVSTTAYYFGDDVNIIPPTSTEFTVHGPINYAENYIAYLFATLAGVSKVGSYTGNGSSQTISCGFTAGARFILIKSTNAAGDWYVWDTERGIVAGNDPHLSLNTTAAEVTTDDSIDPDSSGFIVNQVSATNINVSSAEYIFYAIA